MIVVLILFAAVLCVTGYTGWTMGYIFGRRAAGREICDLNDLSFERRCKIETENLRLRQETETVEQKKRLENAVEYAQKVNGIGETAKPFIVPAN